MGNMKQSTNTEMIIRYWYFSMYCHSSSSSAMQNLNMMEVVRSSSAQIQIYSKLDILVCIQYIYIVK